jgi:hypothetical protein
MDLNIKYRKGIHDEWYYFWKCVKHYVFSKNIYR